MHPLNTVIPLLDNRLFICSLSRRTVNNWNVTTSQRAERFSVNYHYSAIFLIALLLTSLIMTLRKTTSHCWKVFNSLFLGAMLAETKCVLYPHPKCDVALFRFGEMYIKAEEQLMHFLSIKQQAEERRSINTRKI